MNEITFTYKIISVNEEARCMEIIYTADGHQTMHVGVRLPYEGESLEAVISAFAPVPYWREKLRAIIAPEIGLTGKITASIPEVFKDQPVAQGTQTL